MSCGNLARRDDAGSQKWRLGRCRLKQSRILFETIDELTMLHVDQQIVYAEKMPTKKRLRCIRNDEIPSERARCI